MNKILEMGRSMVEMLGVLAIVGILAVGSFAGYKYAITRYWANQLINQIMLEMPGVNVQARQMRFPLNVETVKLNLLGGQSANMLAYYDTADEAEMIVRGTYFIGVRHVPLSVCQRVVDSGWQVPVNIYVTAGGVYSNIEAGGDVCGKNSDDKNILMEFEFPINDLGMDAAANQAAGRCETVADCPSGCNPKCDNGVCKTECAANQQCTVRDDASTRVCCSKENSIGGYCCASMEDGRCCNSTGMCCPSNKPLTDMYGNCYSCDDSNPVYVYGGFGMCSMCPNRVMEGNYCKLKCPSNRPLIGVNGQCYSCSEPARIEVSGVENNCLSMCGNARSLSGDGCIINNCPGNKPLKDLYGSCHACSEDNVIYASNDSCTSICGNDRKVGSYSTQCVKKCPADKPLLDASGVCYACESSKQAINVAGATDNCQKCSNRTLNENGYCVLGCKSGQFYSNVGDCYSCSETKSINVTGVTANCTTNCPDRVLNGMYCSLGTDALCSGATPLKGIDGVCYACDTANQVKIADAEACTTICPNREMFGAVCRAKCTSDQFQDSYGACYDCAYAWSVDVTGVTGNCSKCSNRKLNGNLCTKIADTECASNKPLKSAFGQCFDCDTTEIVYTPNGLQSECEGVCSNRESVGGYCRLQKDCSFEQPIKGYDNTCYSCDTSEDIFMGSDLAATECESLCGGVRKAYGKYCSYPLKNGCPANAPLKGYDGKCHACTEEGYIAADYMDCLKACPKRSQDGSCAFCPTSRPLYEPQQCYSCDSSTPRLDDLDSCSKCPNRQLTESGDCALKCPVTKPLMDSYGVCYSCDEKNPIDVNEVACTDICGGRRKVDDIGQCILIIK